MGLKKVVAGFTMVVAVGGTSFKAAEAVRSYHGSDYSYNSSDLRKLYACDRESDSNKVKGVYDTDGNRQQDGAVHDNDGSNGNCASGYANSDDGLIDHHRTCERATLTSWDCDNYVAVK
jgi:hypothetical protein